MNKRVARLGLLAAVLIMAGCRSGAPMAENDRDPAGLFGDGSGDNGASTSGIDDRGGIAMTPEEAAREREMQELMRNIVVYFEFDQSDIRAEFNEMLAAHADFLQRNRGASVRLEGHADETGSREYNIGLGERRAQAVRRILTLQGASPGQLTTVSYGEERPAALGSDEESYGLNRRVELVYE
jgi:peptidoglycan-associated lipoprotein